MKQFLVVTFILTALLFLTSRGESVRGPKININTASVERLQELPLIGPMRAQSIVDYREKNGPFRTLDEITRIKGIGKGILKRITPHCSVGRAGTGYSRK